MRFLKGKSKEDFERMANTSEYLGEAYEALQKLSADEIKRLEYEEREKALKDYNTFVIGAQRRAEERGRTIGEKRREKRSEKRSKKVEERKESLWRRECSDCMLRESRRRKSRWNAASLKRRSGKFWNNIVLLPFTRCPALAAGHPGRKRTIPL